MSKYFATNTPQAISENSGTIQNLDHIQSVLVNDSAEDGGGLVLWPLAKFMWSGKKLYIRKYDKTAPLDAEVEVISVGSSGGGGGGGGGDADVEIIDQEEVDDIISSIDD